MYEKRLLLVANVAKEHVRKFHIPTIQKLKENGWKVDVACSMDTVIDECDYCWDMKYKRNPISLKTILGVFQLRKILKKRKYDIVYCHTPTGSIVTRLAVATIKKSPVVVYMAHGFHFFKTAPLKNWLFFYPIEKLLAKWTDYLITINQEDFELAQKKKMYKRNIYKIPGVGVDFSRLGTKLSNNLKEELRKDLGIEKNDIVLVYVAELISNKNQGKLLETLKLLLVKYPNIKLLLVGPDHNNGKYLEYAKKLNVENNVIFTGWRNDVGNLLQESNIYVASSIREGFGINLVEAMACGLPVIAFENRGHKEIIKNGENGYLIEQGNINKMAEYIEKILDDSYIYNTLSEKAKKDSQNYEKNKVTIQIINIMEHIFNNNINRRKI